MDFSDLVYACAFNRIFGYNAAKARKLVDAFPDLKELFDLDVSSLETLFGVGSGYVDRLKDNKPLDQSAAEVEWASSMKVKIMFLRDADYPSRLKECEDAPVMLFYKGNADLDAERCISIVGTRNATPYGLKVCRQILESFSTLERKPLVVSGLAYGVDICSHKAALELGLNTVGVMATGLDTIYPSAHGDIAARMVRQGGLLTEFWRNAPPDRINFLRRNRIIAGICDAVVLIESDSSGGGMVTAKMADSYSRTVFALPGRIGDRYSSGCNALIAAKCAEMINNEWSVLTGMGWGRRNGNCKMNPGIDIFESDNDGKRNILLALSRENWMDVNCLINYLKVDSQRLLADLTELEMEDRVQRGSDGKYSLK